MTNLDNPEKGFNFFSMFLTDSVKIFIKVNDLIFINVSWKIFCLSQKFTSIQI